MLALLGYPAALLIGVSLGLIGAGGAILTIPVLVYLFDIPPHIATTYSLFIVGFSASVGSVGYIRNRLLSLKTVLNFGVSSILSVFITRRYIFPVIPEMNEVFGINISKDKLILYIFSVVMIFASYSMIRKESSIKQNHDLIREHGGLFLVINGVIVGVLAGLVGAGGGFLIIPVLVIIQRLPMKVAIGTSLLIISLNSFIGFAGDLDHVTINWKLLFLICVLSLLGIFIGLALSKRIEGAKLKPAFGWFILVMGVYIIAKSYFI